MKHRFLFFLLFLAPLLTGAQTIDSVRQHFIDAFRDDDRASAALWLDSLDRLGDDDHVALLLDERWLAYCWLGWYGNLFDEAASFDVEEHAWQALKEQPPADSLFQSLDRALFADRHVLYEEIRRAFLNEEERAFTVLMLDYLLRVEPNDGLWTQRADAFLARFPASRFTNYLRSVRQEPVVRGRSAVNFNLMLFSGTWRGELEGTLRPSWGIDLGFGYWHRRINVGFQFSAGSQKLDRNLEQGGFIWPEDDASNILAGDWDLGYDIISRERLRIYPTIGGGFSYLSPPTPSEDEEPNPDYYSNFEFFSGHFTAALTADVRFPVDVESTDAGVQAVSNQGVRLRVGYRRLYFGSDNPSLRGDLIFVSLGYQLFVGLKSKKK